MKEKILFWIYWIGVVLMTGITLGLIVHNNLDVENIVVTSCFVGIIWPIVLIAWLTMYIIK